MVKGGLCLPKSVLKSEELPLPIVKKILSKRAKESKMSDLMYQQRVALEYANRFSKMSPSNAAKVLEKLMKKYGLSRTLAVQIINIAPRIVDELRILFAIDPSVSLTTEQMEEIVELVQKNVTRKIVPSSEEKIDEDLEPPVIKESAPVESSEEYDEKIFDL